MKRIRVVFIMLFLLIILALILTSCNQNRKDSSDVLNNSNIADSSEVTDDKTEKEGSDGVNDLDTSDNTEVTEHIEKGIIYRRVDANGKEDDSGSYTMLGEYPQTLKADDVTVTEKTDSRGYYLGSDKEYYAKVEATPYLYKMSKGEKASYIFSTGADVTEGEIYYFKVEPLRWRILTESDETALIFCDSIIANHRYDDENNNYEKSEIRAWLNDTFFKLSFNKTEKAQILTTTVDNSVASTGFKANEYACGDTEDKVFLLSNAEVTNDAYGFMSFKSHDKGRRLRTSDYSKATGVMTYIWSNSDSKSYKEYEGNGYWWWLRSPSHYNSHNAHFVDYAGSSVQGADVDYSYGGVVPAIQINLTK